MKRRRCRFSEAAGTGEERLIAGRMRFPGKQKVTDIERACVSLSA